MAELYVLNNVITAVRLQTSPCQSIIAEVIHGVVPCAPHQYRKEKSMTKTRGYLIEPPVFNEPAFQARHEIGLSIPGKQTFLGFSVPLFIRRRVKTDPVQTFIVALTQWATNEYYTARDMYALSHNFEAIKKISRLKPHHVLARWPNIQEIFQKFNDEPELWAKLSSETQDFYMSTFTVWKAANPTPPQRVRVHVLRDRIASLPRYDDALARVAEYDQNQRVTA